MHLSSRTRSELLLSAHFVEKLSDFGALFQAIALISFGCGSPDRPSPCDGRHWLELGQFPEVLGGGCEGKLVLNATWAP